MLYFLCPGLLVKAIEEYLLNPSSALLLRLLVFEFKAYSIVPTIDQNYITSELKAISKFSSINYPALFLYVQNWFSEKLTELP